MIRTMTVKFKKITSLFLGSIMLFGMISSINEVNAFADTVEEGSRIIVSLGDSFSSGEGIGPFYGQDKELSEKVKDYDWLAHRSQKSWSGRLTLDGVNGTMAENRDTNWYFVASSGAKTKDLEGKQQKVHNVTGKKDETYLPAQLDIFSKLKEEGKSAEYVTMSMGGNDAEFGEIIKKAVISGAFNPGALNNLLQSVWSDFYYGTNDKESKSIKDKLYAAYNDIKIATENKAKIIIAGYPRLLDENGKGLPFSKKEAELINDSVSRFNKEIESIVNRCKAEEMKICFVSVEEEFQGKGAYSSDPYIHKVIFGAVAEELLWNKVSSAYSIHPNDKGAAAYAKCVQAKIDEIEASNGASEWPSMSSSEESDVALVLDVSGSMAGNPMEETKKASEKFVNTILEKEASVGVVTYNNTSNKISDFSKNDGYLNNVLSRINAGGGTNIEAGLSQAYLMLQNSEAKKKTIVLMSDGEPNEGKLGNELIEFAEKIKSEDIYIYTLGFFGSAKNKTSAQALLENIASDGCHYEVDNADDLRFFFGDIADQINGQKYIYIRIACPVDVTVSYKGETLCSIDTDGSTRTSFGTLTFEENEKENSSSSDNRIKILRLKEGSDYDIQIEGNGRGYMNYTIGFMDDSGEYSDLRKFSNVKITKSTVIDTVANNSNSTVLKVDEDGDGKYDLKYKATENSRGEVVDYTYVIYIAVGVVISIIILTIVIKIKKRIKAKNS